MPIEAGKYSEEEKKQKISQEKQENLLKKEALAREERQKVSIRESSDTSLSNLKDIISHHDIDEEIMQKVENISADGKLDHQEIKEILDIIDDMQSSDDVLKYLPAELIISKDDFMHALSDDIIRQEVLVKLDNALWHIYQQADAWTSALGMIGMVALVLDKKLVTIQENHIDIQDALLQGDWGKKLWLFTQIKQALLGK